MYLKRSAKRYLDNLKSFFLKKNVNMWWWPNLQTSIRLINYLTTVADSSCRIERMGLLFHSPKTVDNGVYKNETSEKNVYIFYEGTDWNSSSRFKLKMFSSYSLLFIYFLFLTTFGNFSTFSSVSYYTYLDYFISLHYFTYLKYVSY